MLNSAHTSVAYALVRVAIWVALLVVAAIDGFIHRQVRSRGWQLYAMLCGAVALFVIRNLAFLGMVVEGQHDAAGLVHKTFGAFIFFSDLADSYWIFLLLALSAGLCITRNSLGPHRAVCITIPIIFGVTSLVVDYVLFSTSGLAAFEYGMVESSRMPPVDDPAYDPAADPLAGMAEDDSTWTLVFLLCLLAKMMSFILAWFYMYDTARMEWEALRAPGADAQGAAPPAPPTAGGGGDGGVGHRAVPTNAALLEDGQNASHMYGDVVADDLDAPKTVQERIADRDKERLMRRFFHAVCIYIIAAMVVFFLPSLIPNGSVLMIFLDCLLWVFAAALLAVFRLRESSQFLPLDEEGLGGVETTTELGVLNHKRDDGGGRGGRRELELPAAVLPRFTLHDEEEGGGGGGSGVNASAAAHGVVVRPLPSPHT